MAASGLAGVTPQVTATYWTGCPPARGVVKKSRLLEELDAEATPYAATPLAKRAIGARKRLALLFALGAAGFAVEGALARDTWMIVGTIPLLLIAASVWFGRLGGIIAAGFVAVVAFGVSVYFLATSGSTWPEKIPLAFVAIWGIVLLPDIVTLIRDAELQNAYGMWARR